MNYKNFKETFLDFVKQHKYALFVFILIILIVFISFISSLFAPKEESDVEVETETATKFSELSSSEKNNAIYVYENFKSNTALDDLQIENEFTEQDVAVANKRSYLYSFESYSIDEFKNILNIIDVVEVSPIFLSANDVNVDNFLRNYLSLLNKSVSSLDISFTVRNIEQKEVAFGEHHLEEALYGDQITHFMRRYYLYLGGNVVTSSNGKAEIILIGSIKDNMGSVDFPRFFPKETHLIAKRDFDSGKFVLVPSFSLSPDFEEFYLFSTAELDSGDITFVSNSTQVVYVYDSENGLIIPLISKTGQFVGSEFEDLEDKNYIFSAF